MYGFFVSVHDTKLIQVVVLEWPLLGWPHTRRRFEEGTTTTRRDMTSDSRCSAGFACSAWQDSECVITKANHVRLECLEVRGEAIRSFCAHPGCRISS